MSLTHNDQDLSELLGALCDGAITPEQFSQLEQLLSDDPEARECYVNYMMLCGELKQIIPACPEHPGLPPSHKPNKSETHVQEIKKRAQHSNTEKPWETKAREDKIRQLADESFKRFKEEEKRREQERLYKEYLVRRRQFIIGISSLAALLAIMLFVQFAPEPQTPIVSDQPVLLPVVATVTDFSDAQWKNRTEIARHTELRPGSMTLEQGYAQLTFRQGAQVLIQAPCTFELQSSNKMALQNGFMTANVPTQAVGFTVQTPWATVVDYGTEFGLSTGQKNGAEVHVFKGRVGVGNAAFSQMTAKGQATIVDQAGHIELQSLGDRPNLFVRHMPKAGSSFGIPGKRLDLADVVGGGNGFGTGVPGRALDPVLTGEWQEVSRTYDAASLAGVLGQDLTIVLGVARGSTGGQAHFDDVSLAYVDVAQRTTISVPNGDFETLYKPGTEVTGVVADGGWSMGVGPECPIDGGAGYEFSDGTTGANADITGWVGYDLDGWVAEGGTYERDITDGNFQGNISFVDDNQMFGASGGGWRNPAGGLITSAGSLGTVVGGTYTLSMMARAPDGAATPVVFDLLADGAVLTPTSSVDPSKNNTRFSDRATILRRPFNKGLYRAGSGFIGIEKLPFIDGIFVPNGNEQSTIISSTRLLFQGCPDTQGTYYDGIVCGAVFDDQKVHTGRLAGHSYETPEQPSIGACANVGITFDLECIRASMSGSLISRFTAHCGISETLADLHEQSDYDQVKVTFWVLVDGRIEYSRELGTDPFESDQIDIAITPSDRFLTLITTTRQKNLYCWSMFAEPALKLERK